MNNETKFEIYSFSHHNEDDVSTDLTFTVPAVGTHISTFHEMCKKFAHALGYADKTIEEWFGESGESFEEFMR